MRYVVIMMIATLFVVFLLFYAFALIEFKQLKKILFEIRGSTELFMDLGQEAWDINSMGKPKEKKRRLDELEQEMEKEYSNCEKYRRYAEKVFLFCETSERAHTDVRKEFERFGSAYVSCRDDIRRVRKRNNC